MAEDFAKDVKKHNGVVEESDLEDYKVRIHAPLTTKLGKLTVLNAPPPTSGPVLALILNILRSYHMTEKVWKKDPALVLHRIIEAFKFAYAQRAQLGDPDFEASVKNLITKLLSLKFAE